MSPKFSALLILIILDKAGSSVRPVVTFKPNWDKIFTTEFLTMTCNVRSPIPADMRYTWYKNNNPIHTAQSYEIRDAKQDNSGNYQCKGTNTNISDPVRLDVSHDWVILQAPLYVHEGDDVTLRCHHYPGYSGNETIFYKDNGVIRNWGSDPELRINNINLGGSRGYKCTKEVYHHLIYYQYSGGTSIPMKEIFTTPEIKVTPFPVLEGDDVTVTCHTNVSPYRPETELQFAFHKDMQNIQSFNSSNQYGFQSAKVKNSGRYYCEAKTVSGRIIVKRSKMLNIELNAIFTQPEIIMTANEITEGDNMTLTCHTVRSGLITDTELEFAFYRDGKNVQEFSLSDRYEVQSAELKHSGNYSCKVRSSTKNITRSSEEVYIQIQELFSKPEIEMIPDVDIERNQMILTCNTIVMRNDIELQFSFYKNGQKIQEFNSSHQYVIPSTQLEDSGNYYCEVRTSRNGVKKRSEELTVGQQGNTELFIILLPLALVMLLLLVAILVTFFICSKHHFVKTHEPTTEPTCNVQPEISYSVLAMFPMSQNTPLTTSKNQENNVTYATVKPKSRSQPAADPDSIYQNT
ncbi:Fc receptor-like protein 5 isoform X2 [Aquarana catesbeiana]|uniref:Fc receptor-like protein 5 isoform X2 n=1 Tax=Aquarana catesbeiana TaxID=8400 RepID=UPI003CC9DF3E